MIKDSRLKYSEAFTAAENERIEKNTKIKSCLEKMYNSMLTKHNEIELLINQKQNVFYVDLDKIEEKYEGDLREKETKFKSEHAENEVKKKEIENEIKNSQSIIMKTLTQIITFLSKVEILDPKFERIVNRTM